MSPGVVSSPEMRRILLVVLVAVIATLHSATSAAVVEELPEGAHGCQIDSPTRDECIRDAVQEMLPKLSNGHHRLNIPALDPLKRNSTLYEYKRGNLHALVYAKDITVYGVSKAQIKDVRTHITDDGMESEFDTYFPKLYIEGAYKGEGRIDELKFNSKGNFNFTFTGLSTTQKLVGHFVHRDGHKYLELTGFDLSIFMKDFQFFATGLFPDPELNQLAIGFVNQYWPFVYQQILPQTKSVWEPMFVKESNAFLAKLPYDKMLWYGDKKET